MTKRGAGEAGPVAVGSPVIAGALAEYEEAIRKVRDVLAVRIVSNSHGDIEEIHVLAGSGRGPKQIVRDVESSLMARFGLPVDHKKISVAQIGDSTTALSAGERVRLLGTRFALDGLTARAEVRVDLDGAVHSAVTCGPATTAIRLRTVAEAALSAVEDCLNNQYRLGVDDVQVFQVRNRQIVVTVVSLLNQFGEEALVGSALLRGNEAEAVAAATLDAVSRRWPLIARGVAERRGGDASASGERPGN